MAELPSTEKVINTYRQVTNFYSGLEKSAAKYQTEDKSVCALEAVGLTVRFLLNLKVPRELLAPLIEAAQIVKRELKVETLLEQQHVHKIWDSAVVSLLNAEGVKLEDAAKKIHEHDHQGAARLLTFRNTMRKGRTGEMREARDLYHLLKTDFKSRFPTNTATRALRASKAMRGKKGQSAR
jgi:hypothetical protein